MRNKNITWSIVVLGVAGGLWACGSDDDSGFAYGGGAGGGAGVAAAGGHSAGAGGASAGKGGAEQGGAAQGGQAEAGMAGVVIGEAGAEAGFGGVPSIIVGDSAGSAGQAGGTSAPTLTEVCTKICADEAALTCTYAGNCLGQCVGLGEPGGSAVPDEYFTMVSCQAAQLTATNYACSPQSNDTQMPGPKASTACASEICKWTCDDAMYVDEVMYGTCGC
jgi:hypothetical protein